MTALSDLINQRLAALGWDGLSVRDLAQKSDGALSKDNVSIYRKGTHGTPSETTLASWSDILQTPIEDLREAAGLARGGEAFMLPPEAARLNQRQRRAITEIIMSMVEGEQHENAGNEEGGKKGRSGRGIRHDRGTPMTADEITDEIRQVVGDDSITEALKKKAISALVAQLSARQGKPVDEGDANAGTQRVSGS